MKKLLVLVLVVLMTFMIPGVSLASGGTPIYGPQGQVLKYVQTQPIPTVPAPSPTPSLWTVANNAATLFALAPVIITGAKAIYSAFHFREVQMGKIWEQTGVYDIYRGLGGR